MKSKVLNDRPERTIAVILERGEEVMAALLQFAIEHRITAGRLTAIGALESATVGFFDWERKTYRRIPVDEQVEVLSLVGDIALDGDQPRIHAHAVLGRSDGSTVGGHLLEAHVRPTLEVMVVEAPSNLQRTTDEETGLALLSPR